MLPVTDDIQYDENDDTDALDGGDPTGGPRALREAQKRATKRAEQAETRASELETKLAALERREAFRDANLDLANPMVKFFADKYDGDLTADAIKTAAEQLGLGAATAPPAEQQQGTPMQQQQQPPGQSDGVTPEMQAQFQQAMTNPQGAPAPLGQSGPQLKPGMSPNEIANELRKHGQVVSSALFEGNYDSPNWMSLVNQE